MNTHTTVLITGASSGIGAALARHMAAQGHDLLLTGRNENRLSNVRNEILAKRNVGVQTFVQDLSEPNAAQNLHDKIKSEKFKIHMLVNNAGFGDHGAFKDADLTKLSNMIQVNITALTELTHLILPEMTSRGSGKIMNVASTAAFMPGPFMAVYFATKAYVLNFSEAIGNEIKAHGITVTTLCPGATATEFQKGAEIDSGSIFKGRLPSPDTVAAFGYNAMMRGKPVAIHGRKNQFMTTLVRFFPRRLVTKLVRSFTT